jgi:hypothetical protein
MGFGVAGRAACQWRRAVTNRRLPARFIWAVSGMAVFVPTAANAVNGARRGGLEPAEANGYRSGVLGLVSKGDLQEKGHD